MKLKQIRELSDQELLQKEKDLKGELFNLRFQAATGQLDNPMRIREVRKTIARIKTVLTERQNERLKLDSQK
jgi:large subunit ribosomal protein L29